MRLIDADALKIENVDLEHGCTIVDIALAVIKSVSDAPTIDVENFVRYHIDEISRTIHWQLVEVDTEKPYCPHCGAKMEKDGEAPTIDPESLRPTGELIDKIASYLERDGNWEALKQCWLIGGRSDELREMLHMAVKGGDSE